MAEFFVGDQIDEQALDEFVRLLGVAYSNGEANGSRMDWSDVNAAREQAVAAFGDTAKEFEMAAEAGFSEEPKVTFPLDADDRVRAAATLLYAYRHPHDVDWEDVDLAWELAGFPGHKPPVSSPSM